MSYLIVVVTTNDNRSFDLELFDTFEDLQLAIQGGTVDACVTKVILATALAEWDVLINKTFDLDMFYTLQAVTCELNIDADVYSAACSCRQSIMEWETVYDAYRGSYNSMEAFGEAVFYEEESRAVQNRFKDHINFASYGAHVAQTYTLVENPATDEIYVFSF